MPICYNYDETKTRRNQTNSLNLNPLAWRRKPDSHAAAAASATIAASPPHEIPQGIDERSAPGLVEDGRSEDGACEDGQLPEAREQALFFGGFICF